MMLRSVVFRQRRFITIGIRREEKNRWETRVPIIPEDAKVLSKLPNVNIIVQPCTKRIFTDKEYLESGATVKEDLSKCDLVVGVKEIPTDKVFPGKTHICFSHTHKGQPKGVPLLRAMIDKKATLVDYELLTNAEDGSRVLAFGKFAGYVGMVNCLHGLGDRFLQLGYRTPFLNIGLAHHYPDLEAAKKAVQLVGKQIQAQGLPEQLGTVSFVFTGTGNVSSGAQEIFKLLPSKMVKPKDFAKSVKEGKQKDKLIGTVLEYADFSDSKAGKSRFGKEFAPYTTALVNGIYWDASLPRVLSREDMKKLTGGKKRKLVTIADISCDYDGGIQFTTHATTIDEPFMYYNPHDDKNHPKPVCDDCVQLMTIDNLPAQLPRDASAFFSAKLSSIFKDYIKEGKSDLIDRATIIKDGKLVARFEHLGSSLVKSQEKSVLVLGSGYVSKPAVDYLCRDPTVKVIVASNSIADAKRITDGIGNAEAVALDVANQTQLSDLVRNSSVVLSLLPAAMHPDVAKHCIQHGKSLVTGSYISPAMAELNGPAMEAGITILNEIGLDPGLDHLSAMKMIDEIKSGGDKVESFVSWCGGLPAPECADNPFGYKFSWRPQGVLLATQNPAKYLLNGNEVNVAGKDLLRSAMPIKIHKAFAFEGLPNRDSTSYIKQYGLEGIRTMFRGTLRYRGFSDLVDSCSKLGLLNQAPLDNGLAEKSNWREVMDVLIKAKPTVKDGLASILRSNEKAKSLLSALEWLGAFSASEPFKAGPSMLDSFAALLEAKLVFQPGERDMAFMFHEVKVKSGSGKEGRLTSTLIEYGDPTGYSAMAKTVGVPVAVATKMVLEGKINQRGVIAPLAQDIYDPMLAILKENGIAFKETHEMK